MQIRQMSVAEALASVHSSASGLSSAEAGRRLAEHGANVVSPVAREPLAWRLAQEYFGFFSVILWVAAALAFFAEWFDPGQGMAKVGVAIVAVILVSGSFSFWQEHRIERTLASLRKLLPEEVNALRDGNVVRLPVEQLVPGDVIHVEAGQSIPADCRLLEAHGIRVNTATITGESRPKVADALPSREEHWINSRCLLLAGTSLVAGRGSALVFATGAQTEFGRIAQLTQTAGDTVSPLRLELAHLSRRIAFFAVLIGIVFLALAQTLGIPFWQALIFSIGIIVAMVPEGLLPTLTLALVLASQRMARRQVLIRHLPCVETLGSATVICTDKTGTLTENRMRVEELLLGLRLHPAAALGEERTLVEDNRQLLLAAAFCHSLEEAKADGKPVLLGDPMEIALVELAARLEVAEKGAERVDELPFDTDRMRQSVLVETATGRTLYCKGAPESVLPLCGQLVDAGVVRPLDAAARAEIQRAQEQMAARGLRVIAFAWRTLPVRAVEAGGAEAQAGAQIPLTAEAAEEELVFCGLAGLEDPPRPEVPAAIAKCREAGIRVIMVTGDHPQTALAIARQIGLVRSPEPRVLTGEQLRHLSATQLQLALDSEELVFARLAADQKMRIVVALRRKQQIVAVTGDGVNDAPALKAAHIGIAMGRSGTDVAKEAADMVLLDDNFASIVAAVEEGRAVFGNIRKFLTYVLVHNVAELVPYLAFALFRVPIALTPIQALTVDMGTDSLTALGLGVEKPDPQAMRRPPRAQNERLFNAQLVWRAYLFLGLIEAAATMSAFFFVLLEGGWSWGEMPAADSLLYRQATSAALTTIIVLQIVNVFLCRSSLRSLRETGISGNPLILGGVVLELILLLLIDYTPWGNALFATAPPPPSVWLCILPFALAMLVLEEVRKWVVRRRIAAAISRESAARTQ
ncbi:cation-translocating P-type ATPase [Rhodocyclus purpureus]|uniref:cation-translocating P-type ATPase n=1 Tax=Rhodocyclus purpureus TaxID=1067 RepID=UPI001911F44B|nr:cation-transporting P-type ATPase [Rhodocyclus purpureus]MBK5913305.1 ATPase [Rhodocyclus purpureus]